MAKYSNDFIWTFYNNLLFKKIKKLMLNKVKYPIGKFEFYDTHDIDKNKVSKNIKILDQFHAKLKNELNKIPSNYLNKPYRDGGWSIYKLIHHLADSHMHAYIRCKYAYISDKIRIMDYVPDEWANTEDCSFENINYSLIIIKGIHKRWVSFFSKLKNEDFRQISINKIEKSSQLRLGTKINIGKQLVC